MDKKLHNKGGNDFVQSVDYRYNIRGWVRSINNSQLAINADNDEDGDFFGMEMLYNNAETGLNDQTGDALYYNGNMAAIKWKGYGTGTGVEGERSYKFIYDKAGRLKNSTSQARSATGWNADAGALNENMTYDHNGNIGTLTRNGIDPAGMMTTIDNLTYTYDANKLTKVTDSGITLGFNDQANNTTEYAYDTNGSLTKDDNKGISNITYNVLNKPKEITFTNGRILKYTYSAAGTKLKMEEFMNATPVKTTDYVAGFVYEDAALKFFGSPEGRVVKNGTAFEYEYAIADHQGNTRVVFSSVTPAPEDPLATLEGDSNDEADQYLNVDPNFVVAFLGANHTPSGANVVKMNQTYKVGPSKSLKVFPGDKVDIEVWEYHEGTSGFGTSSTANSVLINLVSAAFGGVSGGSGESGAIYNGVEEAITIFGSGGNQGTSRPAAYLNYILFDKDYNVLDAGWQLAPDVTFTQQKLSFPTKEIDQEGYLFVYLSYDNDSDNWVYFDDFKVTHTKTNVIQYNEYYPFGLQTANSWTRENASNNYLYNGGSELNTNSGWYETFFRGYDAALGRFLQVDPLAHMSGGHSPYNYAFNNPVLFNDPNGDYPREVQIEMERRAREGSGNAFVSGKTYSGYDGPGSGNHWSDQYRSGESQGGQNMTASEFVGNALYSGYSGGTWSNGKANFFENDAEAVAWAMDNFDSFPGTEENAFAKLRGITSGASWVYFKYNLKWTTHKGSNVSFKYVGQAQQEWSPEFVNDNFGDAFQWQYRFSPITFFPSGGDEAQMVSQMQRRLSGIGNKMEYYLIPEPSNPTFALRPVSYQIQSGDNIIRGNLVDPTTLNSTRLWGNPGNISPEGTPTPINYTLDNNSVISLIIFFQRPFAF